MATVIKSIIPWDATALVTLFNSLNCPLIEASSTTVTIDDIFTIYLGYDSWPRIYVTKDGTYITGNTVAGNMTFIIGYSDNLVYINMTDNDNTGFYLVYEKTTNFTIYTHSGTGGTTGFNNIQSYTFTDINSGSTYTRGAILNYAAQTGYINYATNILFYGGTATKAITDPLFVSCSTITLGKVITFNGTNYFSVGTNTLLRMD